MIDDYWLVYWPCEGFRGTYPINSRSWPSAIVEQFKKNYDKKAGGYWFSADDQTGRSFLAVYKKEYGVEPFSFRVGKYRPGREEEHPFYLLNVSDSTFELSDGDVYEDQYSCGNPPPEVLRKGKLGCGQGKQQIKNLWFATDKKAPPKTDLFRLLAGPRFPYSRVYGISARLCSALIAARMTGFEIRPILDSEQKSESGYFQLTVMGSTRGAFEDRAALIKARPCHVCGYVVGGYSGLPPTMRTYPLDFFDTLDLQVGDRLSIGDVPKGWGGDIPPLFASARFMKLIRDGKFTGWNRAAERLAFWPVNIRSKSESGSMNWNVSGNAEYGH